MHNSEFGIRNSEWKQTSEPDYHDLKFIDRGFFLPHSTFRIPHSKGFTLLEVMVAVSIMSLVLVTLLGLKNRTVQNVALAEHITTATMLAKRMMVDTIGSKKWQPVEEDGDFAGEEHFTDYTWKRTISQIPLFSSVFITEIRIAVLWMEGTRPELVELVDYE